jgi:hypothetical protein
MSQPYSTETRKILDDFLKALARNERVDPAFLDALRQMTTAGELGKGSRIGEALAALEERADELQNRYH